MGSRLLPLYHSFPDAATANKVIGYRHNVCQLKKKDSPLANVGYAVGIKPTAQSHNQGGES